MNHSLLLYGRNAELLYVRKLVLRSAGHEVRIATEPQAVEQMIQKACPDVLILCHTLLDPERARVLDRMLSLCPGTKALILLAGKRSPPEGSHASLATLEGPRRLLEVVDRLAMGATSALLDGDLKLSTVH